ncbi:MAG: beta-ketoacyl-ACP synthase II, partial [Burkholderiaceae bacterium]|nr:beta-ketoacyl-ACP synthase II [Burkholderiaceae bacterium]
MSQIKGQRRVVVTGLGLVSPVGNSVGDAWQNLLAGRSGIATVTKFDHSNLPVHFAGEVKNFNVEDYVPAKEARHMDTFIHYGIAAGTQAFRDSGLTVTDANAERIGVLVGSGIGGLPMIEETHTEYTNRGARRISP